MLKHYCASCGQSFKNSPLHYKESGNFCKSCLGEIHYKMAIKKAMRTGGDCEKLLKVLKERWGVTMEDMIEETKRLKRILAHL